MSHFRTIRDPQPLLGRYTTCIDVQCLPKTFQDAIFVTRKLGLRYVWIDSLCILQDCADDWRAESSMMRYIYLYGALNIAASAASSDHEGLSFPRNPHITRHIPISVTWDSPDLLAQKPRGAYYLFNGDIWDREVEFAPLNARGWVLQERLLAPRILHFGRNQLYWQCNTIFHSEMFPRDLRTKNLGPYVPRVSSNFMRCFSGLKKRQRKSNMPKKEDDGPYARWSELANAYSATALTRGQDKLIAVQALAETMRDATGDAYVAGLWRSRIVDDVLWRTEVDALLPSPPPRSAAASCQNAAITGRSQPWRAPTWSWASLDCQIEARSTWHYSAARGGDGDDDGKRLVRKMVPEVAGFNDVGTGQLRDARLRVEGLLYRNTQPLSFRVLESPLSLYRAAEDTTPWSMKVVLDEWDAAFAGENKYVIPTGALFFPVGSPIAGTVEGLLLEPVPRASGHFKRTAYFEVDLLLYGSDDILEEINVLEDAHDLGLAGCVDGKGRTLYPFTLL
ncbi:heterokaryon incompatibility protein [Diplodia corticola]|uniref:Heterokaryon incompatibility protein n=1 Tax=Diplodia corticola TaxID=236234 RepID=A0A1J9RHN5_9PEZI|nr:heterokaryon incompatibility protein [Diplodia corticola]OJD39937.1 heterokaryon incompatibility protein [Diplodia corticola]